MSSRNGVVGNTGTKIPITPNASDIVPKIINTCFIVLYSFSLGHHALAFPAPKVHIIFKLSKNECVFAATSVRNSFDGLAIGCTFAT